MWKRHKAKYTTYRLRDFNTKDNSMSLNCTQLPRNCGVFNEWCTNMLHDQSHLFYFISDKLVFQMISAFWNNFKGSSSKNEPIIR